MSVITVHKISTVIKKHLPICNYVQNNFHMTTVTQYVDKIATIAVKRNGILKNNLSTIYDMAPSNQM